MNFIITTSAKSDTFSVSSRINEVSIGTIHYAIHNMCVPVVTYPESQIRFQYHQSWQADLHNTDTHQGKEGRKGREVEKKEQVCDTQLRVCGADGWMDRRKVTLVWCLKSLFSGQRREEENERREGREGRRKNQQREGNERVVWTTVVGVCFRIAHGEG